MATNGTEIGAPPERPLLRRRVAETRVADREYERSLAEQDQALNVEDFALAPLVDKIAWGIARGLVVAVKELEEHIATETRKVGDTVDHRMDLLQAAFDEVSKFVGEQRGTNAAVQTQLQELAQGLRAAETREAADVGALSERINGLTRELGVHQEDIAAIKAMVSTFSSRVDALAERLDRQADAVRSMCTAYSQRETELEQLVDGLARLRAFPTPIPANGL